jgi:hypothetical protein
MKNALLLLVAPASAYVLPLAPAARCALRRGAVFAVADKEKIEIAVNAAADDTRECLVEAENAAEIDDCLGVEPAAAPASKVTVDECIVEAENAAEIAACSDTTLGTTVEECIVQAENAAEIADCGVPPSAPAARAAVVDECIVEAENAAEIAACSDTTLGTTYEDCVVAAESAEELADCVAGMGDGESTIYLEEECVTEAESAEELLACGDTTLGTTYEECIVQAENALEIADCGAPEPLALELDEVCVTEAESQAELSACNDVTLGTTYEECIVSAENAVEIEDCGVPPAAPASGGPGAVSVDEEECIVQAENAVEIADCKE